MIDSKRFFEGYRTNFDQRLKQRKVDVLNILLGRMNEEFSVVGHISQFAYILATAYHETGGKMLPVKEIRQRVAITSRQRRIRRLQDRYWYTGYYGRGLVQITWERNYRAMSDYVGVDLITSPDLALNPVVAVDLLFYGSVLGKYTGKKLGDYLNHEKKDYYNARRVINGTDKAALVAGYARVFEEILNNSIT